ncbi:hypothetical protein PSEUDO8O_50201 [Pseudomonas sp. 8O]|nr:hypothetical protein PSEUDO8O_50201 [Pseudomonas sp. 8O]
MAKPDKIAAKLSTEVNGNLLTTKMGI